MRGVDTAIPQLSIISFDGKAVNQGYGFFTSPNNEMAQRRPRKKRNFHHGVCSSAFLALFQLF